MYRTERQIGTEKLIIEVGKYAQRAESSATAKYGDTVVFAAVSTTPSKEDADFIRLYVDYREYTYAAGKIPGGFIKREGRPRTKETLTMRLIDRSLRPLFPKDFADEVSVTCYVLSADENYDPAVLGIIAASAALNTSELPVKEVVGGVQVGLKDDKFVIMPTYDDVDEGDLDLLVSGTSDHVSMVECGANEVPEDKMVKAISFAHNSIVQIVEMIEELQKQKGVSPMPWEESKPPARLLNQIRDRYEKKLVKNLKIADKKKRDEAMKMLKDQIYEDFLSGEEDSHAFKEKEKELASATDEFIREVTRRETLNGNRIGGRKNTDVRKLDMEVGHLPRTHGSAVFTRGETQALVITTLGTTIDEQRIEGLTEGYSKSFMLHYNFPAFCVGETWPNRGPGRREIGHGALAERAIKPVLPPDETFPYTMRVVSDVMSSNGSSSMATVCGGTLSLMDAGVPIIRPVAGIAMGLMKEGSKVEILTDILGDEDHIGDMDFKVAGTQLGITALQMDIKIAGVTEKTIRKALDQAREGRLYILRNMLRTLERPRKRISKFAPKLVRLQIPEDKIGAVIGPGGKVIRELQANTDTNIEIEDDGEVTISGETFEGVEEAKKSIEALTKEAEVGKIYDGKVVSIKDFGAFVEILPRMEGLLHISELSDEYVKNVRDHVSEGDEIKVKVIGNDNGKIKLSRKGLNDKNKKGKGKGKAHNRN